jgi:hypothetical protein
MEQILLDVRSSIIREHLGILTETPTGRYRVYRIKRPCAFQPDDGGEIVTPAQQYELLVESLRLMASSPAEQVRALPEFVVVTDEIVSTFGDAMLLMPQLARAGLIKPEANDAIQRVDSWLDSMPMDGSLTDACTLESHEFWRHARTLAAQALDALGVQDRAPTLHQVTWVEGSK